MEFNDLKGMFGDVKARMDAAIDHVRRDMAHVRTGRASDSLLDGIQVEAYGTRMPINQVATLSVPEPALILAQPFDPSVMGAIEKAIRASDLGLNPANDGKVVRIPIPALTEDRRKDLSRHVHKQAEEGRNAVRQVRRDELPSEASGADIYAIHDEAGNRIGIAPGRDLAFIAARQHALTPVSVH